MISKETSAETFAKLGEPYRGRLVAVTLSEDGQYWRMFTGMGGRSAGSQNRYYRTVAERNGNGPYIRTEVENPDLEKGDPATTIYEAHRSWEGFHVASNGEQTGGIGIVLASADDFVITSKDAEKWFGLAQRRFKHEGPDTGNTPRITAAIDDGGEYILMGKIVPLVSNPEESDYHVYSFAMSLDFGAGQGFVTTTYDGKGGTGANYDRPWGIILPGTLEEGLDKLWKSWGKNDIDDPKNPGTKMSTRAGLIGKEIEIESGKFRYVSRSIHAGREFSSEWFRPSL